MIDTKTQLDHGGVRDWAEVVVLRVHDEPALWPLRRGLVIGAFYKVSVDDGVDSIEMLIVETALYGQ